MTYSKAISWGLIFALVATSMFVVYACDDANGDRVSDESDIQYMGVDEYMKSIANKWIDENIDEQYRQYLKDYVVPGLIEKIGKEFGIENLSEIKMVGKYTGSDEVVRLSDKTTVDGKVLPVVGIADGAFKDNKTVESVVLPDSYLYIGTEAFMNCENLYDINMPDELIVVRNNAFRHTSIPSFTFEENSYGFLIIDYGLISENTVVDSVTFKMKSGNVWLCNNSLISECDRDGRTVTIYTPDNWGEDVITDAIAGHERDKLSFGTYTEPDNTVGTIVITAIITAIIALAVGAGATYYLMKKQSA